MRYMPLVGLLLLATPTLAHGAGGYWLQIYNAQWSHTYGTYPTKEACEAAAKEATSGKPIRSTCVPAPAKE